MEPNIANLYDNSERFWIRLAYAKRIEQSPIPIRMTIQGTRLLNHSLTFSSLTVENTKFMEKKVNPAKILDKVVNPLTTSDTYIVFSGIGIIPAKQRKKIPRTV